MEANVVWIEGYKSVLDNGRGHSVTVDLPPESGGTDVGPTGLELAIMALAGCATTIFKLVAAKRKLTYESLKISLNAEKPKTASTITERTRRNSQYGNRTGSSDCPETNLQNLPSRSNIRTSRNQSRLRSSAKETYRGNKRIVNVAMGRIAGHYLTLFAKAQPKF